MLQISEIALPLFQVAPEEENPSVPPHVRAAVPADPSLPGLRRPGSQPSGDAVGAPGRLRAQPGPGGSGGRPRFAHPHPPDHRLVPPVSDTLAGVGLERFALIGRVRGWVIRVLGGRVGCGSKVLSDVGIWSNGCRKVMEVVVDVVRNKWGVFLSSYERKRI